MQLSFDPANNRVDLSALRATLPQTPEEVLSQLHVEHGRNPEFHTYYDDLDLANLRWRSIELTAMEICNASCNPNFAKYVRQTKEKALDADLTTLKGLDGRLAVLEWWRTRKTWLTPPVFIPGALVRAQAHYHLVEGHTRVGVLCGLLKRGALSPASKHVVWLGSYVDG